MTGDNTDNTQLGDVAELDKIASELETQPQAIAETVEAQAELDANGGVAFPYDPVIAQNVQIFTDIAFKGFAKKYGAHWALPPDDCQRLSVAISQVVHHYMPDMDNMGVLGNLGVVAAGIMLPRVVLTKMQSQQTKKEQPKEEALENVEQANK